MNCWGSLQLLSEAENTNLTNTLTIQLHETNLISCRYIVCLDAAHGS